jgi:hydrogenase maturation factor
MKKSGLEGLRLSARFAIQPNTLGICGDKPDQPILRQSLKNEAVIPKLRQTFNSHKYPDLSSFLTAISQSTGKPQFSRQVVESYWFGNELTNKTLHLGRKLLIDQYSQTRPLVGLALDQKLPPQIYLTHFSQVVHIAARDYSDKQRLTIINQCMIAAGKVVIVDQKTNTATVEREVVIQDPSGKLRIVNEKHQTRLDPDLTSKLTVGDSVAIHQGFIASKLDKNKERNLRQWNKKVATEL